MTVTPQKNHPAQQVREVAKVQGVPIQGWTAQPCERGGTQGHA